MLSGFSMAGRAFDNGEGYHCRACTVKVIGEAAAHRLEAGLSERIVVHVPIRGHGSHREEEWRIASRWEVDEHAVEFGGYELGAECEDPEHARLREEEDLMWSRGEGYCPGWRRRTSPSRCASAATAASTPRAPSAAPTYSGTSGW